MDRRRYPTSKQSRGNNGEEMMYIMLSVQLDSNYFLELGCLKNSSLFSDKGCCNCSWRKPGATDTHTLETVGKALVNLSGAHWLQ